jgi:hypothetical protein
MKATLTANPRSHHLIPLRTLTFWAVAAVLAATAIGGCRSSASERDRLHAELKSSVATLEARAGGPADTKATARGRAGAKSAKGAKGAKPDEALRPIEAGAFGSITGQIYPLDAEAVVHFYGRDDEAAGYAFSDPSSGSFTVPELPVDIYRVVVRPEDPALEPRVLEDVVVPWGGEGDLGTIDLRPGGEQTAPAAEESDEFDFENGISADVFGSEE